MLSFTTPFVYFDQLSNSHYTLALYFLKITSRNPFKIAQNHLGFWRQKVYGTSSDVQER